MAGMQLVYLVGSVIWATMVSFVLTLQLWKRLLCQWLFAQSPACSDGSDSEVILYEGRVWHERRRPVVHSFQYNVRYALVNLDRTPTWLSPAIRKHHMNADQVRAIAGTTGPVYLLTMPPSVGYEQNPLSVYYCYDAKGPTAVLTRCIAEVTNTPWAERASFIFDPKSDLVAKALHVSPFMDVQGDWKIHAYAPTKSLSLTIQVHHPIYGNYFTANLQAKKVERPIRNPEVFLWLLPQKVAIWIYWQAFKLWWKGVPFIQHPEYLDGKAYREQALRHDRQLRSIQTPEPQNSWERSVGESIPGLNGSNIEGQRWCVWRDAQWPLW